MGMRILAFTSHDSRGGRVRERAVSLTSPTAALTDFRFCHFGRGIFIFFSLLSMIEGFALHVALLPYSVLNEGETRSLRAVSLGRLRERSKTA